MDGCHAVLKRQNEKWSCNFTWKRFPSAKEHIPFSAGILEEPLVNLRTPPTPHNPLAKRRLTERIVLFSSLGTQLTQDNLKRGTWYAGQGTKTWALVLISAPVLSSRITVYEGWKPHVSEASGCSQEDYGKKDRSAWMYCSELAGPASKRKT